MNDSDASAGPHASLLASGSELFDCATAPACQFQHSELNVQMTGSNDVAAFLLRNEYGGDPIADTDTVIDLIDEETLLTTFSCGAVGGCSELMGVLSFSISAGDAMAFVIRAEINEATGATPVPEPGGLAALLMASCAAVLARRRQGRR